MIFIDRDEAGTQDDGHGGENGSAPFARLILAKHRNGPNGVVGIRRAGHRHTSREPGSKGETARHAAYGLYAVSERKRRAADALAYNSLVESGPEFVRLAGDERADTVTQGTLAIDEA